MNFLEGVSIIIPSWDNLKYLKACISSIKENSLFDHEIIVHLNEPKNEELNYLIKNKIKFTSSSSNIGVSKSMNIAYKLCTKNIIGFFNDDMIALKEWDKELQNFSEENKCDNTWILSSTMIEPHGHNPSCVAPANFGDSIDNFDLENLNRELEEIRKYRHSTIGSTWPPNFLSREIWDKVGGYSEEYINGFGSDPDLIAKCYAAGCRNFIAVGKSLVYHFQCKTTKRVISTQDISEEIFKKKFGVDMNYFIFNLIKRGSKYELQQ